LSKFKLFTRLYWQKYFGGGMKKYLLLIFLALQSLSAQWVEMTGPFGPFINCLASSPNGHGGSIIFAIASPLYNEKNNGIYFSTNNGQNWTATNSDLKVKVISSLAVSSNRAGSMTVFAGTDSGIFLSTDTGASWTAVNVGLPSQSSISFLAVTPDTGNTGSASIFAGSPENGIFRSTNNGASWTAVNSGLIDFNITSLAVGSASADSDTHLYAVSYEKGIFHSTDKGASWTAINNGLPKSSFDSTIIRISSIAVSGDNLLAGLYPNSGGIYISTNHGSSWTAVDSEMQKLYFNCFSAGCSNVLAVGLNNFIPEKEGNYFSTNNGKSWTHLNDKLKRSIFSLVSVPHEIHGTALYAGTRFGVFLSVNNGANWAPVNSGLPANTIVNSLLISPDGSGGTTLFTGANCINGDYGGLLSTSDHGNNWTQTLDNLDVLSLAIDPNTADSSVMFAGCAGRAKFGDRTAKGIFRSTDRGNSWTSIGLTEDFIGSIAFCGSSIFTGSFWGADSWGSRGVFRSTDNGSSWISLNSGLPATPNDYHTLEVRAFGVIGTKIFACVNGRVFLLANNDTIWSPANTPFSNFSSMTTISTNLFAGTDDGIYFSSDSGATWMAINSGLTNKAVKSLTVSNGNIFAKTSEGGIFLSTNNGTFWIPINTDLSQSDISAMAVSNTHIYVGTNASIWQRPLSDVVASFTKQRNILPCVFSLQQNYPNPFNPTTVISYQLPVISKVTLKIYDVLGREVATLVNEEQSAGTKEVQWNASGFASGMYLVRMQANNFVETKKILLMK